MQHHSIISIFRNAKEPPFIQIFITTISIPGVVLVFFILFLASETKNFIKEHH